MIDMTNVSEQMRYLLAALNFIACAGIGWACVCRFSVMSKSTTSLQFRTGYTLLFVAASASGLSPLLFREWPGPGQIALALAALYVIGTGIKNWRNGPPDYARSGPMPLDDAAPSHVVGKGDTK